VLLWVELVAGLVIEDPLLSVGVAAGFLVLVSGTAIPNVRTVCDCDSDDDDSLE